MQLHRFRTRVVPCLLVLATLAATIAPALRAQSANERQAVNSWEVYNEIKVAPGTEAQVGKHFPTFLEYQDMVMFHPKFGYYASGRVNFTNDYQTFPIVLAPYFGRMVAEQVFRMWTGMRKAGTLSPSDRFTIAEFGAGDGALAESILEYLGEMEKEDPQWEEFAKQAVYVCYDRSPALNKIQRERNSRFGKRFEAREADATALTATIPAGSLKGVVLSNELPDAFSVHKVILSPGGMAEVGYVVPTLTAGNWERLKQQVPETVAAKVETGNKDVRRIFFPTLDDTTVFLTRDAFSSVLEARVSAKDYPETVKALGFREIYVPASVIPELDAHLKRYARVYAGVLAKSGRGVVTYINLGVEKFVQTSAQVLKAGYMMTIDYGATWDEIIGQDTHPHLRTYGPANRAANGTVDQDVFQSGSDTYDPYDGATLNDLTTDVNFSLMGAEGDHAGMKTMFYGPQWAMQHGTSVSLETAPQSRQGDSALESEYFEWAEDFKSDRNFKIMVQQKDGTDSAYRYPTDDEERLTLDESGFSETQVATAAAIEKRLSGMPAQQ